MQVKYILTEREKDFLVALAERGGSYHCGHADDEFRSEWRQEIDSLHDFFTRKSGYYLTKTLNRIGKQVSDEVKQERSLT